MSALVNEQNQLNQNFDFWIGEWKGHWLFLTDEGKEVTISKTIHKVFSKFEGSVIIETAEETGQVEEPAIICGLSLRYYNKSANKWVMIQCWPSNKGNSMGTLAGSFDRNRISMQNSYTLEEVEYKQKYTFSDISDSYFRWDRQVSEDEGMTWKTTMKLHFDRMNEQSSDYYDTEVGTLYSFYEGKLNIDQSIVDQKLPTGEYSAILTENSKLILDNMKLEIFDIIGGYGQLIIIEDREAQTQFILFLNYGTNNEKWNLVIIENKDEITHSTYQSDTILGNFTANYSFDKLSHGIPTNSTINFIHENNGLVIEFSSNEKKRKISATKN